MPPVHLRMMRQFHNFRKGFKTLSTDLLPEEVRRNYDVAERHHACAILRTDFPTEWNDLIEGLTTLRLTKTQILTPGGGKSPISKGINGFFYDREWQEKVFDVQVSVDGAVTLSPTHHVDYYKNRVAIETEWNNKDPFYDRDLTTFRLLIQKRVRFRREWLSNGKTVHHGSGRMCLHNGGHIATWLRCGDH